MGSGRAATPLTASSTVARRPCRARARTGGKQHHNPQQPNRSLVVVVGVGNFDFAVLYYCLLVSMSTDYCTLKMEKPELNMYNRCSYFYVVFLLFGIVESSKDEGKW